MLARIYLSQSDLYLTVVLTMQKDDFHGFTDYFLSSYSYINLLGGSYNEGDKVRLAKLTRRSMQK